MPAVQMECLGCGATAWRHEDAPEREAPACADCGGRLEDVAEAPYLDPREPAAPSWMTAPTEGHPSRHHPGVHRLPVGDTRHHEAHRECWCAPTQTLRVEYPTAGRHPIIGGTWQHHAADGRSEARS